MSRILWLDGLEGHNANTRDRFIYIHGTKHEDKIGKPDSHGCIRMRNADVIELFDLVDARHAGNNQGMIESRYRGQAEKNRCAGYRSPNKAAATC